MFHYVNAFVIYIFIAYICKRKILINQFYIVMDNEILTTQEAAKMMRISKAHLYRLMSTHQIPYYKPSHKLAFFLKQDIVSFMLSNKIASNAELY